MKRAITNLALLLVTFIFVAASSVAFTIQEEMKIEQSLLKRCRSACSPRLNDCLARAGSSRGNQLRCYDSYRQCLDKCTARGSRGV